ncbi:Fetuin-B [Camelus dromedarius]|uniref:Fetuin-B n=1 Tax=Camelus dromedarius TaxID=9838 RepID=A0A5N4EKE1_CAMDR|nr:Fetuin-B [Camelus dromedarius]
MGLLLPLVLCALVVCCRAAPPTQQAPSPSPLLSHSCNSSYVLEVANFILQDINRNRKDGYVLSLNRVSDVREHRQASDSPRFLLHGGCAFLHPFLQGDLGSLFYYTLDVLETDCHVLSRRSWKNCSVRYLHLSVSACWVTGPAYFVEYLIKESPCTISQASSCALQSSDSVPVGLCKGSLNRNEDDDTEKLVWVTCEFFKSQVPTPGGQNTTANQGPTNLPKEEEPRQKAVSEGAILCLPSLDDEDSGQSQGKGPVEAFPVQLDLTTNPQGEPLDVSFLLLEPVEEELVVLPFPSKEQRSAECPGPAQNANPLILPP